MKLPDPLTSAPSGLAEAPAERVMRQLLEALLFERLAPFRCSSKDSPHWQTFRFRLGNLACSCRARLRGFGRLRIDPRTVRVESIEGGSGAGKPTLEQLVAHLPASPCIRQRLFVELQQTIRLCQWNQDHHVRRGNRRALAFAALDSALDEGHPYHPCFKARSGFTLEDHRRYGPEAGQGFRLRWLAVASSHLETVLPTAEEAFWFSELGFEQAFLLRAAFNRVGADWANFSAVPVHPWQWRRMCDTTLADAIARGEVRYLGSLGDEYRASQSVRSLFNASGAGKAMVKLPLAMGNTSSVRTLEPHSVPSAPAISRWLANTVAADPLFASRYRLELLREYAATLYTGYPESPQDSDALAGQLGAIWRENPAGSLRDGEQAVPMNALACIEDDGAPFIDHWIGRYGARPWLEALVRVAIEPVWHLLVAHGIAVEAHAQNMLLIHRDGWPVGIVLRDFHDSVEYVEDFLADPGNLPDFGPRNPFYQSAADDRYYRMARVESLRELVVDTLFVFNLSELAWLAEDCYQVPESWLWARVRAVLDQYADRHPEHRHRLLRLNIQQPWVVTESLLTRKLRGAGAPECHHLVPNTLSRAWSDPRQPGPQTIRQRRESSHECH